MTQNHGVPGSSLGPPLLLMRICRTNTDVIGLGSERLAGASETRVLYLGTLNSLIALCLSPTFTSTSYLLQGTMQACLSGICTTPSRLKKLTELSIRAWLTSGARHIELAKG